MPYNTQDINSANAFGNTPLSHAIYNNDYESVRSLIMQGAKLDYIDLGGSSYLALAIEKDDDAMVKILLDYGANPNIGIIKIQKEYRINALDLAKENIDIAALLILYGADYSSYPNLAKHDRISNAISIRQIFINAITDNNMDEIIKLLAKGISPNIRVDDKLSLLQLSMQHDDKKIASHLIFSGAILPPDYRISEDWLINSRDIHKIYYTYVTEDLKTDDEYLMHLGKLNMGNKIPAFLNYDIEDGNNLLHIAAKRGFTNSVNFLLEKSANPNLQNKQGFTALHHAVTNYHFRCVTSLVKGSTDVNIVNHAGKTALDIAREINFSSVTKSSVSTLPTDPPTPRSVKFSKLIRELRIPPDSPRYMDHTVASAGKSPRNSPQKPCQASSLSPPKNPTPNSILKKRTGIGNDTSPPAARSLF
jgi:ankyrin repeat protein